MSQESSADSVPGGSRAVARDKRAGAELRCVLLVDLPSTMAIHVLEVLKGTVPGVTVQRVDRSALRFSTSLPPQSLLMLPDPVGPEKAEVYLERLRQRGVETPALILGVDERPILTSPDTLAPVDSLDLEAFDAFALRRTLMLFESRDLRDRLLDEMVSRLRAYERLLESKDDERLRVLEVAGALERQLAEKDEALRALEGSPRAPADDTPVPPFPPSDPAADSGVWLTEELFGPLSEELESSPLEADSGSLLLDDDEIPSSQYIPPPLEDESTAQDDLRQMEERLSEAQHERSDLVRRLGELRKHSVNRERELRRLRKQSATAGDLAQRLEASERLRSEQTREMLRYQQRVDELESHLEQVLSLVDHDPEAEPMEPAEMLEGLARRLRSFEVERRAQQGTIDQLSRSLAVQQVDDTLDNAQSRRNVLQRVDEAVQRSMASGEPLTALMIGIDHPDTIRQHHGSVLYDFMLVQVAQRLQLAQRRHDILMRYGDEAFVLLTDSRSAGEAHNHAERLQQAVSATPLELGSQRIDLTIRIAIVPYEASMQGANDLLRRSLRLLMEGGDEAVEQIVLEE